MSEPIRIGIIGAGGNTVARHIPLLQKIAGVEIVAVCNRSLESSRRVCERFGIPEATIDARGLIERRDLDAIVIGTWPYKHAEFSMAALESGKHVLCEARMAMNGEEARQMLAVSQRHPDLVAQVVPAPSTLAADPVIRQLVESEIGELLAVHTRVNGGGFPDDQMSYGWRHDRAFSGNNIMGVGIYYESLMRWVGPAADVYAVVDVIQRTRWDKKANAPRATEVPDQILVAGRLHRDKAAYSLIFSHVAGFDEQGGTWIHGRRGTIHVESRGRVELGRKGEERMVPVDVAAAGHAGWRVEEEFINAIRGQEKVKFTTFADGVQYMRFLDAIHASAAEGRPVQLR